MYFKNCLLAHIDGCVILFFISFLKPNTPEEILKFRGSTQPAPGKTRIFYGRHGDPDIASHLTHGINTKPSYVVSSHFLHFTCFNFFFSQCYVVILTNPKCFLKKVFLNFKAGQLVNPKPLSYFKFRLNEKREEATYASRQRAPLGMYFFNIIFLFAFCSLMVEICIAFK